MENGSSLGDLFQRIVNDMKNTTPLWEDFIGKTSKLNASLRSTSSALSVFLDALQKIADVASNAKGATKDIGSALTRLCLRHRSIESKLKTFNTSLIDVLGNTLHEKLEEWKKSVSQIDKEHSKELKKVYHEMRKISSEVTALQNKVNKGKYTVQARLDHALKEMHGRRMVQTEMEKSAVRSALIEERSHFCFFISWMKPVLDVEISMLTELLLVQEVVESLCCQAGEPFVLPLSSEQVISDSQDMKHQWFCQTPPASPISHKSSMCSINSSHSSQSSGSSLSPTHRETTLLQTITGNVSSAVSSQDSGFMSHDPTSLNASFNHSSDEAVKGSPSWLEMPRYCIRSKRSTRPNTISSAYEQNRNRPPINPAMFEPVTKIRSCDVDGQQNRAHPRSLPPTPNPYAMPILIYRKSGCLSLPSDDRHDVDHELLDDLNSDSRSRNGSLDSPQSSSEVNAQMRTPLPSPTTLFSVPLIDGVCSQSLPRKRYQFTSHALRVLTRLRQDFSQINVPPTDTADVVANTVKVKQSIRSDELPPMKQMSNQFDRNLSQLDQVVEELDVKACPTTGSSPEEPTPEDAKVTTCPSEGLDAAIRQLELTTANLQVVDQQQLGNNNVSGVQQSSSGQSGSQFEYGQFVDGKSTGGQSVEDQSSQSVSSQLKIENNCLLRETSPGALHRASLRRCSLHGGQKPPPPIRRTSSMAGTSPMNRRSFSMPIAEQQDSNVAGASGTRNKLEQEDRNVDTTLRDVARVGVPGGTQSPRGVSQSPREVTQSPRGRLHSCNDLQTRANERLTSSRSSWRSLSETHADIIQTLNQQFSGIKQVPAPTSSSSAGKMLQYPSNAQPGKHGDVSEMERISMLTQMSACSRSRISMHGVPGMRGFVQRHERE